MAVMMKVIEFYSNETVEMGGGYSVTSMSTYGTNLRETLGEFSEKWKLLTQQEFFCVHFFSSNIWCHQMTIWWFTCLAEKIGCPWSKLINCILKWEELKLKFATVIAHWGLLLLYNEANNFKWNYSFYVSGEFARRSDSKLRFRIIFLLT